MNKINPPIHYILGIESSCDETAAAIVDSQGNVIAHQLYTQLAHHQEFGGVVPEIAARAHLQHIQPVVNQVLETAKHSCGLSITDIAAIAATVGPGLIGGLVVGANFAKALAVAINKPFIPIHHLEAHGLVARMQHSVTFPHLMVLLSGGHSQILLANSLGDYRIVGQTLDDAVGECFDKAGKVLGLPYPGGPHLEQLARQGDSRRVKLPVPLDNHPHSCNLSYSGLKTAVQTQARQLGSAYYADIAARFQEVVALSLSKSITNAINLVTSKYSLPIRHLVVAGGVAANQYLRQHLLALATHHQLELVCPPPPLCTDNGIMIAWAGMEYWLAGRVPTNSLSYKPTPRWPLEQAG